MQETKLVIVVPCYNEAEVLPQTNKRLLALIQQMQNHDLVSSDSCIYYVDDGSNDAMWQFIKDIAIQDTHVHGIKLTRNYGHQCALLAGLCTVDGDIVISIDADLQDDINVISDMVKAYHKGYDVVFGVRNERNSDSFFKRVTAQAYYKLLNIMGINVVYNHADFRLMSRRALDALKQFKEVNLFLRGLVPSLGFPSTIVEYARHERLIGESKYPLGKMLALAINGITSFSALPLRLVALLGILIFVFSLLISLWVLWVRFVVGDAIPGWASSVLPMYFLGGVQLFSIGLIGEYISKIYMETKQRPRFIIEEKI